MGTTWKEKKCPRLKAFPLDDLMNEHSVGSALKKHEVIICRTAKTADCVSALLGDGRCRR